MKEAVLLAVVNEKGGGRSDGRPWTTFPVRTKGWYPVTSKEYAARAAKETTRAFRAGTDGETVGETGLLWGRSRGPAPPPTLHPDLGHRAATSDPAAPRTRDTTGNARGWAEQGRHTGQGQATDGHGPHSQNPETSCLDGAAGRKTG